MNCEISFPNSSLQPSLAKIGNKPFNFSFILNVDDLCKSIEGKRRIYPDSFFGLMTSLLFLLFRFMNVPTGGRPNRIVVSPGQVEQLVASFSGTWMRPPTEDTENFWKHMRSSWKSRRGRTMVPAQLLRQHRLRGRRDDTTIFVHADTHVRPFGWTVRQDIRP